MKKIAYLLILTCTIAFTSCGSSTESQAIDEAQEVADGKHTDSMAEASEAMQNQQAAMDTLAMDTTKAVVDTAKR